MADSKALLPIDVVKKVSPQQFRGLLQEFWDFSLYHGNQMKIHTDPEKEAHKGHTSSTTLVPTPMSRVAYERAVAVQPIYNILYHRVATDRDFLTSTLSSVRCHDDFMDRHLQIYERLRNENITPTIYLALNRSDYLCHLNFDTIKQVEFNTMAAAASGVNRAASLWHRYVMSTLLHMDDSHIPDNNATNMLAKAMVKCWELYSNPQSVIVFLTTGPKEFNFADQRSLQYDIHKLNKAITLMRVKFDSLSADSLSVDGDRKLFINGQEVALVYFRAGYSPKHYPNDTAWDMRYEIERSKAVKCPSIDYHLAGTKRVQQVLATTPGVMERWLDADSCRAVRETFIGFRSFAKDEGGEESVALAREHPERYVMKPQRDGGGNNIYKENIVSKIESSTLEELSAYTLMETILPPTNENFVVNNSNTPNTSHVVSELGMFGALIVKDKETVMNEAAGFLFRSKPSDRTEGDLMRGTSSLDSPWLI